MRAIIMPCYRFIPIGRLSSTLPCGRGITCTLTSSPTRRAAAAPASVAAFTAATSPRTIAVTKPAPIFSYPTSVTFAAFTIASAASIIATRPFVSTIPSASCIQMLLCVGFNPVLLTINCLAQQLNQLFARERDLAGTVFHEWLTQVTARLAARRFIKVTGLLAHVDQLLNRVRRQITRTAEHTREDRDLRSVFERL